MIDKLKTSIVELSGRERAEVIFSTNDSFKELLDPFDAIESTHLEKQGIVPQADDGVIVLKGKLEDKNVVVISIEGEFQGGGIGEISGAKIAGALELALNECEQGNLFYPIIFFDTGGVRLQEANFGLLAISEIHSTIVKLQAYVPVLGVIPGKIGSFGGMGIAAGLCSHIIMTKEGRLGLNGPEVIEQEAGIRELDASDRVKIWGAIGGNQRTLSGIADYLIDDDVDVLTDKIKTVLQEAKSSDNKRLVNIEHQTTILQQLSLDSSLTPEDIRDMYNNTYELKDKENNAKGEKENSRGLEWIKLLSENENKSEIDSLYVTDQIIDNQSYRFISVIKDKDNNFYRARDGEFGVKEGWYVAKYIWEAIEEDKGKKEKRVIVPIVDVPGQSYGYNEELLGIHLSCAASVNAYVNARQNGHKIITFIPGNAISGAFLSHGLQGNRIIALNDAGVNVHVMSKNSAALITQRTIDELEEATKHIPAMAYDVNSFDTLGGLYKLVDGIQADNPSKEDRDKIIKYIQEAIKNIEEDDYPEIEKRLYNDISKNGRSFSLFVREKLQEQW